MANPHQGLNVDRVLAAAGLVVAIVSTVFALRTNGIDERANELVREQNKLIEAQSRPVLSVDLYNTQMYVKSCADGLSGKPGVYALVTAQLDITNSGGNSTSLVKVDYSVGTAWWLPTAYNPHKQPEIALPYDIPAGSTRRVHFARDYVYLDILSDQLIEEKLETSSKRWILEIGGEQLKVQQEGSVYISDRTHQGSLPNCADLIVEGF